MRKYIAIALLTTPIAHAADVSVKDMELGKRIAVPDKDQALFASKFYGKRQDNSLILEPEQLEVCLADYIFIQLADHRMELFSTTLSSEEERIKEDQEEVRKFEGFLDELEQTSKSIEEVALYNETLATYNEVFAQHQADVSDFNSQVALLKEFQSTLSGKALSFAGKCWGNDYYRDDYENAIGKAQKAAESDLDKLTPSGL